MSFLLLNIFEKMFFHVNRWKYIFILIYLYTLCRLLYIYITGLEAQEAVEKALQYCLDRVDGQGGCIAIDSLGGVGIHWNTPGMSWASIKDGSLTYGVYKGKTESKII